MLRLTARYEGRVQGVGFRMSVAELASSYPVHGEVCNVADGSVELIAEGDLADLQNFHQAILERMARNVVEHQTDLRDIASPTFQGFRIGIDKLRS